MAICEEIFMLACRAAFLARRFIPARAGGGDPGEALGGARGYADEA